MIARAGTRRRSPTELVCAVSGELVLLRAALRPATEPEDAREIGDQRAERAEQDRGEGQQAIGPARAPRLLMAVIMRHRRAKRGRRGMAKRCGSGARHRAPPAHASTKARTLRAGATKASPDGSADEAARRIERKPHQAGAGEQPGVWPRD